MVGFSSYHATIIGYLKCYPYRKEWRNYSRSSREPIKDIVLILIFTILLYFMDDSSHIKDKNIELISNPWCSNINDFHVYKTTFLNRVMLLKDYNKL